MEEFKISGCFNNNYMENAYILKKLEEEKGIKRDLPYVVKTIDSTIFKMYIDYRNEKIQMSQVQRKLKQRNKDYISFIADLINRILPYYKAYGNMKNFKGNVVTQIHGFYDTNNILRILNGQHRINWIIRFIEGKKQDAIPKNLLNYNFEEDVIYESLPEELKNAFNSLKFQIDIYNDLRPYEEVEVFMKLNTCSAQLNTADSVFSTYGYSLNIDVFKNFCDYEYNKNNLSSFHKKIMNTESLSLFINPGSTISKTNKVKSFMTTSKSIKFFSLLSYVYGTNVDLNKASTIGGLIEKTEDLNIENIINLFNNFTYLIKIMIENSYSLKLMIQEKGLHPKFALMKYIYNELLNFYKLDNSNIYVFTEEEIKDAFFNHINLFLEKKCNKLHLYTLTKTTDAIGTLHNSKITEKFLDIIKD